MLNECLQVQRCFINVVFGNRTVLGACDAHQKHETSLDKVGVESRYLPVYLLSRQTASVICGATCDYMPPYSYYFDPWFPPTEQPGIWGPCSIKLPPMKHPYVSPCGPNGIVIIFGW